MTLFTTQNGLQVMIVNHISTNSSAITLTTLHLRETISSASALLFLLNYQSLMMTHYHFNESNRVRDNFFLQVPIESGRETEYFYQ